MNTGKILTSIPLYFLVDDNTANVYALYRPATIIELYEAKALSVLAYRGADYGLPTKSQRGSFTLLERIFVFM